MKYEEILKWENNYPYRLDRIICDDIIHIILRQADLHPYGIISEISFKNVKTEYNPVLLNWENLFRCSNYYGLPPEDITSDGSPGYQITAVQEGLKPAATIRFPFDSPEIQDTLSNMPPFCEALPYLEEGTTFICRKASLGELFSVEDVRNTYEIYGLKDINWRPILGCFEKPLSFFADHISSGIDIEKGVHSVEASVIVGLLLGYPIESTVAKINSTYKVYNMVCRRQAKQHFLKSSAPYVDAFKQIWLCENGLVFIDGQQENKYYYDI